MPIILILTTQHIALGDVGRSCALGVELAGVTDDPQQFAVILAANPVAGHGGVLARGLPQQAVEGIQTGLGDGGLPSPVATPFGELIEDTAGFGQGVLAALRDQ